jgi:NAD-dependent deacetylase
VSVIADIAKELSRCHRVFFITGAGVSADSGLPTYRGVGGLYEDTDTEDGVPIEVALSGRMLRRNPAVAWKHILRIENACRGAKPNRSHEVIKLLEERFDVWTLTQNVDGFHRDAGSRQLIEIHGNVHRLLCTVCDWEDHVDDYEHLTMPPACPSCDALVRPDVVLFGEMLDPASIAVLERQLAIGFDAVFSVGTTSVFPYIAMPVLEAQRRGALTVEINPGTTSVSAEVKHRVRAGSAVTLDALWNEIIG